MEKLSYNDANKVLQLAYQMKREHPSVRLGQAIHNVVGEARAPEQWQTVEKCLSQTEYDIFYVYNDLNALEKFWSGWVHEQKFN